LIPVDEVFFVGGLGGIAAFLIGIVVANVAVFEMQRALNQRRTPENRISPWLVIGSGSYKYHPYFRYRSTFPEGRWIKVRDLASWFIGLGGVVGFGCLLLYKVRNFGESSTAGRGPVNAPSNAVEWLGLAVLIVGAILSNLAVSKMAKIVRVKWAVGFRSSAADSRSREVIRKYRAKYGNGPLFRNLVIAYGLAGIGAVVLIFGRFVLKS